MPLVPAGPTDLRMSVYLHDGELLILDASADLANGTVTYEDTPNGCGAAQITVGLNYEDTFSRGYYSARNIIEISSGDDQVQTALNVGATKIYVCSAAGYDRSAGHDAGQIALFDGGTLCMRIPVTGVGSDGGGNFITVGAPLPGGRNFTTIPAYGAGTIIYRRRYTGIIMGRKLQSSFDPLTVVTCAGLSQRITEAVCTFALTNSTVDMGTAIFNLLNDFNYPNWPELVISAGNFSLTGQTTFDGSYDRTQVSRVISDLLSAANSGGDMWALRVGHDWAPRLVKLYTMATNTYSYNVTLQQGVQYFEARSFVNSDQDATQLYNTIEVIGDTDPVTNLPARAIVTDNTSTFDYGEIDAQPVTNTACKTVAQCALYGQSLLNQQSAPRSNAEVTVATRNDVFVPSYGLSRGDIILGVQCVTVTEIAPAPNVYGLVTSVVTTVDPGGDTFQYARFSAIEPDWADDVAERANALASALRQNTTTAVNLASYFVSTGAFAYEFSGLVVTAPLFSAIFGPGSAGVSLGGNTFSLVPLTTNWAWISSGNTWTVQQSPTPVPGAILYAIFTANATTIVGSIDKAATGIINIPISALPSMGNQTAPVITNIIGPTYPVVGNGTYDAEVAFDVDVVNAPWLVGVALFSVTAGSTEDPHFFPKGKLSAYGVISGEYIGIWKHIGAGNAEDLYIAYEDAQGRFSGTRYVATTVPNPAGTSAFGPIGLSAPNPVQPATANPPQSGQLFTYQANGGGTYDADFIVYLDSNGTTANNNLAEIEVVIAPASRSVTSGGTGWTPVGNPIAQNDGGVYDCTAGGMGVQVQYSVGVRYVGHTGDRSYAYIVGTTTAAQMAQVPFDGVTIDPNTGYIVISDQAIYPTTQQYALSLPGIGSMLSAAWNAKTGAISTVFSIWLMYDSVNNNGYIATWSTFGDGLTRIWKCSAGAFTVLAQSTITQVQDATTFHNLEFIASYSMTGSLNLTVTRDGQLMCSAADATTPFLSGYIAAQFRDFSSANFIDEKTVLINLGGSPSSSGFKAQANIIPASIPGGFVGVSSPTHAGAAPVNWPNNPGGAGICAIINPGTLLFADGTSLVYPGCTLVNRPTNGGGLNGLWYFGLGLVPATLSGVYYLSQTPPTQLQLSALYADGVIPVAFNLSMTVIAGGAATYGSNTHVRRYT
jgi:hypothetical protein